MCVCACMRRALVCVSAPRECVFCSQCSTTTKQMHKVNERERELKKCEILSMMSLLLLACARRSWFKKKNFNSPREPQLVCRPPRIAPASRGSCAARGDASSSCRFGCVFLLSLFAVVFVVVVSCHSLCLHLRHTHTQTAYAENVNWHSALAPCFARAYWQIITENSSLSPHSLTQPLSLALSLSVSVSPGLDSSCSFHFNLCTVRSLAINLGKWELKIHKKIIIYQQLWTKNEQKEQQQFKQKI